MRHNEVGVATSVVFAAAAVVIALVALGVALTRSSTTRLVTTPTPTPTTFRPTACASGDLSAGLASARKIGKAAYASEPLAVSHNGTYQLIFGPLSAADSRGLQRIASGFGVSVPLQDDRFQARPLAQSYEKHTANGRTYIRVPMTVTDFKGGCPDLRVVIQY
jgi:hypothetical protein